MKDIPQGTSEPVAAVPGGTMPGLTGRLIDRPTPFEPTERFDL